MLLDVLRTRWSQGRQYIVDLRAASPTGFRGLPAIGPGPCGPEPGCRACADACAPQAIALEPLSIDLGRCVFCGDCERACPAGRIRFTNGTRLSSATREGLVLRESPEGPAALPHVPVADELARLFGRSLKLRSVSSGGCNACELELGALGNVNFDLGRYGIEFVASPRHADALVLSGPLTHNMAAALQLAWDGMPAPKFVIACGACTISGGLYAESDVLDRGFLARHPPSLWVPGCPPHPLTLVAGILELLGIERPRG